VAGPKGQLKIESETYVGLSVEGPPSLIAELEAQYKKLFELTIANVRNGLLSAVPEQTDQNG
jgi:hypothetical protein